MRLLLVCDGRGDVDAIKALVHRVLSDRVAWLVDHELRWVEYEPGRPFLDVHDVHKAADARAVPMAMGPGLGFGAAAAKRAFLLAKQLEHAEREPLAVVFVWDADDQPERREALGRARDGTQLPIALGLALPEFEAWCVCALQPTTKGEQEAHKAVQRDLGFDPILGSHQLSHKKASVTKRDAKTVLDRLCGDGPERSRQLLQAPIALLRDRGKENGLCGFCDEVTERLAPLFLLA